MSTPTLAHTFAESLPEMAVPARAAEFPDVQVVVLNAPLARELGLDPEWSVSYTHLRAHETM